MTLVASSPKHHCATSTKPRRVPLEILLTSWVFASTVSLINGRYSMGTLWLESENAGMSVLGNPPKWWFSFGSPLSQAEKGCAPKIIYPCSPFCSMGLPHRKRQDPTARKGRRSRGVPPNVCVCVFLNALLWELSKRWTPFG